MAKSPRLAAIDQARLLVTYLHDTPSSSLDMEFIRHHLEALNDFALAAKVENVTSTWDLVVRSRGDEDRAAILRTELC